MFALMTSCSNQKIDPLNPWNISDNDIITLRPPYGRSIHYDISGLLFKAINPRFIANAYGISKYNSGGYTKKEFELVSFDNYFIPNYDEPSPLTSLNVRKKWNYYLNDRLIQDYARVLISAFMLQAFERVEYIPSDSTERLSAEGMPLGINPKDLLPDQYPYEEISRDGSIRVNIRDISKIVINDNTTLYLINNQVVTRKIYEALNPVFIRSLKRITDKKELIKYNQKENIKEVVDVELFTYDDLKNNIYFRECYSCDVYIVDNVQIDLNIFDALRKPFFKEYREINEENKEEFEPYRKLFPDKDSIWPNAPIWPNTVTIVSL